MGRAPPTVDTWLATCTSDPASSRSPERREVAVTVPLLLARTWQTRSGASTP